MRNENASGGLIGEPKRQAPDTIRGFVFQLWHSVHAWLELREGDQLYLEGAEDFDIVRGKDAVATQVKATTAGISLRSQAVLSAIRNFWFAREANPDVQIGYRFITTSPIVKEQGAPFEPNSGLIVWNQCDGDDSQTIERIRNFLRKENCFQGTLEDFVTESSAQELFEHLISKMSWDAAQPASPAVEDAIRRKLVNYGEKFSILPSESERVSARLLQEVANIASSKTSRLLRREDFLRIFEQATHVSISVAQHRAQLHAFATQLGVQSFPESQIVLTETSSVLQSPPPLPTVALRQHLVTDFRRRLRETGFLTVQGSSGTGKTVLAALISREETSLGWLNLRGLAGGAVRGALNQLSRFIDTEVPLNFIVLDDLDLSPDAVNQYIQGLVGLAYTLRTRRGRLLVTSQKDVPSALTQALELGGNCRVTVPNLSGAEIEDLAVQLGCPVELAPRRAKLVALQTGGHPQLAHARLLTLARSGWPKPNEGELLSVPPEVAKARSETRQLIKDLSDGELELLYRLSLISGLFRRDHAVRIGTILPEVSIPGDCFDRLVGPWVERVRTNYFRLSPLIENSGVEAWDRQKVKELREAIGAVLLVCGNLTPLEVSRVLMLALQSESAGLTITVAGIIIRQSQKIKAAVAQELFWVGFVKTDKPIFPQSGLANWAVRTLQLLVAMETDSPLDVQFVECLESELTEACLGSEFRGARFVSLAGALGAIRLKIPPSKLISLIGEVIELQDDLGSIFNKTNFRFKGFGRDIDLGTYVFSFVSARCDGIQFFDELITALRSTNDNVRAHFRLFFKRLPFVSRMLVDRAWLGEEERNGDWKLSAAVMERAITFGREFDVPELADHALRSLVVIYDEYLGDQDRAFRELERFRTAAPSFLLRDQEATLLLHQKRYQQALAVWEKLLPEWRLNADETGNSSVAFGWRKAGITAEYSELWPRAAELLIQGAAAANVVKDGILRIGMIADSGYAFWKAGDNERAVHQLMVALVQLEKLPNTKEELRAFKLRKTVGQTLIHIFHAFEGTKPSTQEYAPPPAFCSDPFTSERIRELPDSDSDMLWMFLVLIETHARLKPIVFKRVHSKLKKSKNAAIRVFLEEVQLAHTLYSGSFAKVPAAAQEFARIFRIAQTHVTSGTSPLAPVEEIVFSSSADPQDFKLAAQGLYASLVVQLCGGKLHSKNLRIWKRSSKKLAISREVTSWVNEAESLLSVSSNEAGRILYDGKDTFWRRSLTALNLASAGSVSTEELFYSHVTMIVAMSDNPMQRFVGLDLGKAFARQWLAKVKFTGGLKTPGLTVPSIEAACSQDAPGMRKPCRILLAVEPAVSVRLPQEIRQKLLDAAVT